MTRSDHAQVRAYLASRPRRLRHRLETFELYWVQGLSSAQVARLVGVTTGAVTLRVYRLRKAVARWARARRQ